MVRFMVDRWWWLVVGICLMGFCGGLVVVNGGWVWSSMVFFYGFVIWSWVCFCLWFWWQRLGMTMGRGESEGWSFTSAPYGFVLPHPHPAPHDGENFFVPSPPLGTPQTSTLSRKTLLLINLPTTITIVFNKTCFINKNILEITNKFISSYQTNF